MRVTSEMMVTSSLGRLTSRIEQYQRAQSELATGRRILAPSDDAAGADLGLRLRSDLRSQDQQRRNVSDAMSWLSSTDEALQLALNRTNRVRDLTIGALSSRSDGELAAIADEVVQLREELVGIANRRHGAQPLFGGYSDGPAVSRSAGTWISNGSGVIERRIGPDEAVRVNLTAVEAFGTDGSGTDLFTVLDDLETALRSADAAGISAALGGIDDAQTRLGGALATVGAIATRVDAAEQRITASRLTTKEQLSDAEDVDIAEAIMELQVQEVAYQATLGALARALPQSLVAFLR